MNLNERINNDITKAMKEKDAFTLSVLRMLKSAMQMAKKNQQDELKDDEVVNILRKQVKTRNESVLEFEKYDRVDLADKTKKEIEILNAYLPKELDEEELDKIIDEAIDEVNPEGMKSMGMVMKIVSSKVQGRADMSKVSLKIKERLQ